jgi:hypothetical protein
MTSKGRLLHYSLLLYVPEKNLRETNTLAYIAKKTFTANVYHMKLFNLSLTLGQNKLGCFSVENIFIHFCDLGL